MSRVFYIQASPRKSRSFSIGVADAFVEAYRQHQPDDELVSFNLFEKELPAFDGKTLDAKYSILHGGNPTREEQTEWRVVEELIEEFKSADKYVFAVPMWNFGIPYRLKQYIDILVQPGYAFSYSPEAGFSGLIKNRPVFVSYARGNEYPRGTEQESMDLQTQYFELVLKFIGFEDIRRVIVESTLSPNAEVNRKKAIEKAKEMAEAF